MQHETPAHFAFFSGHFSEAAKLLEAQPQLSPKDAVLRAELQYFVGPSGEGMRLAARLLEKGHLEPLDASRCSLVIASQYGDDDDDKASLDMSQRAYDLAVRSGVTSQMSLTACALLERSCNRAAFDASLPLALLARRLSIRCGTAAISAQAHLAFGRLEARVGHFDAARRHFALTRKLLLEAPNLWLSASVDLDESSVLCLLGDFIGALELATRAAETAQVSGWVKGIVAAAANSAFLCASLDKIAEAESHLVKAKRQRFRSPSYALALAETDAQLAVATGQFERAEQIIRECRAAQVTVKPWYELSAQQTLIKSLLAQHRWKEALTNAEEALRVARAAGIEPHIIALRLIRAHARVGLGLQPEVHDLLLTSTVSDWPIPQTSSLFILIGRALAANGSARASGYLERATRLFDGVGAKKAADEAAGIRRDLVHEAVTTPPSPDLDAAVALLELGGHPQILAREAIAVLDAAGCARALALIGRSAAGPRVIEFRGWDAAAAAAAARQPEAFDDIPLGPHRDEVWQILVDPRPELEHRCALIAIRKLISTALTLDRYRRDEKQRAALWPAEALDGDADTIWASEQVAEVLSVARRIAPSPLSILLTGETGTGKEMLARAIHRASGRADRALLPFNCTAVPRDMLESQLFGYRKGAFTGADTSFPGVIRSAAGGTLFLDEIADISIEVQPKLLRFLETHEIHPLGEAHPVKVDVRVIAATNAPLEQLVAEGRFREDLFYRLNVVRLKLPPLRERREEIPPLVDHYLRRFADEDKKGRLTLGDETLEYLLLYSWPGNVRQLANEVRRMVAMADADSTLTPALLSPEIQASRRTVPAMVPADPEVRVRIDQPLPAAVELLEQTMVRSALNKSHGRVEEAARLLGISRKGLFLKRRRWGLHQES